MAQKRNPIELRKLSEESNPRLRELLAGIADHVRVDQSRVSAKPTWGRRFNASGKGMSTAPTIRFSYGE
jgi:hypothetical protein